MDSNTVAAIIGTAAIIVPILISHEKRLTRIESKIDMLIRFFNNKRGDK